MKINKLPLQKIQRNNKQIDYGNYKFPNKIRTKNKKRPSIYGFSYNLLCINRLYPILQRWYELKKIKPKLRRPSFKCSHQCKFNFARAVKAYKERGQYMFQSKIVESLSKTKQYLPSHSGKVFRMTKSGIIPT